MENNNTPVYINGLSKQAWNLLSWLKANQSKDKYDSVAGFHLAAEGKAIFSTDNRTCIAALLDCAVPELEGLPDGFYKIVKVSKDLAILENSESRVDIERIINAYRSVPRIDQATYYPERLINPQLFANVSKGFNQTLITFSGDPYHPIYINLFDRCKYTGSHQGNFPPGTYTALVMPLNPECTPACLTSSDFGYQAENLISLNRKDSEEVAQFTEAVTVADMIPF